MAYRKKITINHTSVSSRDLTDFPLLIALEDAALRATSHHVIREEGGDIHFVASDGARLHHEIERYDPSTGCLKAWVRIPTLSHTADTEIYLCYGQENAASQSPGAVWDAHNKLVRHPNTAPGGHEAVPHSDDLNIAGAITVEAWFHSDESRSDAFQTLVSKWSLRSDMDAFESYDAGDTDGLNTRGYFGAVCDGRYVYFSPQFNGDERHGEALRYDTHGDFNKSESWEAYSAGNTSGLKTKGYYGIVHAGHYIYYIPRSDGETLHSRLMRYDTRGDFKDPERWSAFDIGNPVSYQSAVYDGRYIYLVPGSGEESGESGKAVRYDTQGEFTNPSSYLTYDAANTAGLDCGSYDGACFDGRYVYYAPLNDRGVVLRHDTRGDFTAPESWTATDVSARGMHMCVGAIFDGRYIYYVPYAHSIPLRYDTHKDFKDPAGWEAYDAANTAGLNTKGYDGGAFDGRYIYYIPFYEGEQPLSGFHCRVLRYDTQKAFQDASAWDAADGGAFTDPPNPGGFNGGAFDGRYVYFAPWREDPDETDTREYTPHGKVLRYDTTDADASFMLKYAECGHNGGLCASLPGPTFSVNTAGGILNVRANQTLDPGWHHLAGVYDGARLTLYVDGRPVNQAEGTGSVQTGKADIAIGCTSGGGAQFKGSIAHVRISDTARDAAWIQTTARNLKNPPGFVRVGPEEQT